MFQGLGLCVGGGSECGTEIVSLRCKRLILFYLLKEDTALYCDMSEQINEEDSVGIRSNQRNFCRLNILYINLCAFKFWNVVWRP